MPNKHIPPIHLVPADFQRALLNWYDAAKRHLPWRARPGEKADPYKVWLSEIMLQQTTVKAVIPYFETFMARWPAAEALAAASRDEVLAAWAGLGYYSRARNLYACAQALAREGFPASEVALRALPGVGTYTAAAIAAIAFDEPAAVVDGNVERVIARLFAVEQPLPAAKPAIRKVADGLDPLGAARRLRASDDGPRSHDLHAALAILSRLPGAGVLRCSRSRRSRALPRQISKGRKTCPARQCFRDRLHLARRPAHSFAATTRQGASWRHDGSAVLGVGDRFVAGTLAIGWDLEKRPDGATHVYAFPLARTRVLAAHHDAAVPAAKAFGGDWAALANLPAFALPAVMKKAVASGLEALGLGIPSVQPPAKASRRAAKVSTVEGLARPSTRAGRK